MGGLCTCETRLRKGWVGLLGSQIKENYVIIPRCYWAMGDFVRGGVTSEKVFLALVGGLDRNY